MQQRCRPALHGVVFIFLAAKVAFATSDACSNEVGEASGTVLLNLRSSTEKIHLHEEGVQLGQAESSSIGPPGALSLEQKVSRSQVLSNLEYDSDDGSLPTNETRAVAALEFEDDNLIGDSVDGFHEFVKSKGYFEKDDAKFEPEVWNALPEIKASHNCYMYSLNDLSPRSGELCQQSRASIRSTPLATKKEEAKACKRYFHKPGYYFQNFVNGRASTDVWFREETTCKLMLPMIAADSPSIIWHNQNNSTLTEADSCPTNYYMAALFIQPKAGFHFYRRDHICPDEKDKGALCWSHKPGIMNATNKDASGARIKVLLEADRNYGELNYSELCAFYCVPENKQARTHSDSRKAAPKASLVHHL